MHNITTKRLLPYKTSQLFNIVSCVEAYPEFIPWCAATNVYDKKNNVFYADMVIKFKTYREKYTSKVTLQPPLKPHGQAEIIAELVEGPFTKLYNNWIFTPSGRNSTNVEFYMEYDFKSLILDKIIGLVYDRALNKLMNAFETRAEDLYK